MAGNHRAALAIATRIVAAGDIARCELTGDDTTVKADGAPAALTGIQSFVVGTGGTSLRPADSPRPGSEKIIDDRHGVLVLDLSSSSYEWQFVDTEGAILDQGVRPCS